MKQLWDFFYFFLGNDLCTSKSSRRATQIIISFIVFLVLYAGYSLALSVASQHIDGDKGFLSGWLFIQSLLVLHHIFSACAEKCEIIARREFNEKRRLHRLPTLVRFGGAIFFIAGLTTEVGHTIVHFFLNSSSHESSYGREDAVPQSVGSSDSGNRKESEGGYFRGSLNESSDNMVKEENILPSSLLHFVKQPILLQNCICIPVMFGILYMILLFIFQTWIRQMDAVVGDAESNLRVTLPLVSYLEERKVSSKIHLQKAHSHPHSFFSSSSCIRSFPFLSYFRLFLFPTTMILVYVASIVSKQTCFLSVVPLVVCILCLLARSVYVTIPMLRFLMNQNIGAENPEFTSEMKEMLDDVISSIPGEIEVSRYAWWKVSKVGERKFFLQLKIFKGDPGVISAMARRSIENLLKADVYVECEEESALEVVGKSPEHSTTEIELKNNGKHLLIDDNVIEMTKKCNYALNIPFHQPHYDPSLSSTHFSDHSHLAHGHSHGCCH